MKRVFIITLLTALCLPALSATAAPSEPLLTTAGSLRASDTQQASNNPMPATDSSVTPQKELKPDVVLLKLQPLTSSMIFLGILLLLVGLVLWTYRARESGPGLLLNTTWLITICLVSGIGAILPLPGQNTSPWYWTGAVLSGIACFIAAWLSWRERYFGTGPFFSGYKALFRSACILIAILVGSILFGAGYDFIAAHLFEKKSSQHSAEWLMQAKTTTGFVVTILVTCVLIPIFEEIYFRGFLFDALLSRWGFRWATILSSLIFAHLHGQNAINVYCLALGACWLRFYSGNLRQSILLHSLNNTLAIVAPYFLK